MAEAKAKVSSKKAEVKEKAPVIDPIELKMKTSTKATRGTLDKV